MTEDAVIRTVGLSKEFDGLVAVDNVSFKVPKGEVFGYLGRNGAGKTTTVRMLCTLLPPTKGTATVAGYDVRKKPVEVRRRIGVLPEYTPTYRELWTATEYLSYFGALQGLQGNHGEERIQHMLETFALASDAGRPIGQFSAGMRRRLGICRALLHDPPILFLDEPTKELDIPGKRQMWNLLRGFASEEGKSVFLTTHDIRDVEELCSLLCVISRGRITYAGSLEDVLTDVWKISCGADESLARSLRARGISAKVNREDGEVVVAGEHLETARKLIRSEGYDVAEVSRPENLEESLISLM